MISSMTARRFFVTLLVVSALLLAVVIRPVAAALFLAVLLAVVLGPLHRRLTSMLGQRPRLGAGLVVFLLVALVAGPVVGLTAFVAKEATDGVRFVSNSVRSEEVTRRVNRLPGSLRNMARDGIAWLDSIAGQGVGQQAKALQKQVLGDGNGARTLLGMVTATGSFLFQILLMLIALYFLLVDSRKMVGWVDSVSPLPKGQTHELLAQLKTVSYALVVATLTTSAIQAGAALIGYLIAQVPNAAFFTALTFFFAFIPAIGAATVVQVAALLLLINSRMYAALFLSLWGFLVVALVDNVATPLLMKRGMQMHPAIVFFALLGGLGAFGVIGLLIGPLAVSLFVTLLGMYKRDFGMGSSSPSQPSHSPAAQVMLGSDDEARSSAAGRQGRPA
jgi:predicted PurR-regulated permease PerM